MLDLSFERAIEFARDLIRLPGAPGAEGDVAARVLAELQALGFRDARTDAAGNVIGIAPGRGNAPPVMLSCHLDVVDVGDVSSWERPPYAADVADGFLHGRGAMDIKGPLALQTYAAAHFLSEPAAGDVVVAHTVLEERGGWGMQQLLESGVAPGAVIIGEATNGDVCIGHRGRAELIVEICGTAGHASAPERARNPMDALPLVMPALQRFADALESDPVLGRSTLAPTALETLPRSRNVIPDRVRIVCDWRVLPQLSADDAVARLRDHLHADAPLPHELTLDVRFAVEHQHTWTGLEEDRRLFTPGFLLDPQHAAVKAAVTTLRDLGSNPAVRPWTFATDGGHSCGIHGIPTLGFAPGEERYAHTNRERLALADARAAYAAYPALITAVQAAL